VLAAMDVRAADGKRMLLGVSMSLSEVEVHWRAFLESPVARLNRDDADYEGMSRILLN